MLYLPPSAHREIVAAAQAAYPYECCGLLLGQLLPATGDPNQRQVMDAITLPNRWDQQAQVYTDNLDTTAADSHAPLDQRRRYSIDPQDWLRVQRQARNRQLDIIGVYHSHPDHGAVPSECDRRLAWPQYSYIIAAVMGGTVVDMRSWQLNEDGQFEPEAIKILSSLTTKGPLMS